MCIVELYIKHYKIFKKTLDVKEAFSYMPPCCLCTALVFLKVPSHSI